MPGRRTPPDGRRGSRAPRRGGAEPLGQYGWSEEYEVGIPSLDEEHRRLFRLAQDMRLATEQEGGEDLAKTVLVELCSFAAAHFVEEELAMEEAHYPRREQHAEIHRVVALKMDAILQDLRVGRSIASTVHQTVVEWLQRHILEEDMLMAPYLLSYRRTG